MNGYEQVFIYLSREEIWFCKELSEKRTLENEKAGIKEKFAK